jgi:SAM-dependent methyltransferase
MIMTPRYIHSENIHNLAAPREIVPIILRTVRPSSVLDVGCGNGTWLKVFEDNGVTDYVGIDGSEYSARFHIGIDKYRKKDLTLPFDLKRKFDLVLCLEVAEHIAASSADALIDTIVKHGDHILFSAAIPGQGGQHHVNEQWPRYWQSKFLAHGFHFHDIIRPLIWENDVIEPWYRQNIFLISKNVSEDKRMIAVVHPDVYVSALRNKDEMIESIKSGRQGVRLSVSIMFRSVMFKLKSLFGS